MNSPLSSPSLDLSYPIFVAEFDPYSRGYLVVGGGGGENKTGVPNKLSLIDTSKKSSLKCINEIDLPRDEDSVQSIASSASENGLITYTGINSSTEEIEKGSNHHLRTFAIKFPPSKNFEIDGKTGEALQAGEITALSKTSLFSQKPTKTHRLYQRLLKLSPIQINGQQSKGVGALASSFGAVNELIVFDATKAIPNGSSDICKRIKLVHNTEAVDLDLAVDSEAATHLAYCTDYVAWLYPKPFTASTRVPLNDTTVSVKLHETSLGISPRPKLRCIRWLSARFILLVQNNHTSDGVELVVLRLPEAEEEEEVYVTLRKVMPSSLKVAVALDVCHLDSDPATGERQIIIAIASQDGSIHILTLDLKPHAKNPFMQLSRFDTFTIFKNVHPMGITRICFSNFFAPIQPSDSAKSIATAPQYIQLASTSLGGAVVVETLPLTSITTQPSATKDAPKKKSSATAPNIRWVLSSAKSEALHTWVATITASIVVLFTAIFLAAYLRGGTTVPGAIAELRSFLPAQFAPGPPLMPQKAFPSSLPPVQTRRISKHRSIRDMLHMHRKRAAEAVADESETASSVLSNAAGSQAVLIQHMPVDEASASAVSATDAALDTAATLAASLHDNAETLRQKGAKPFEELTPQEKAHWKRRLKDAGHWAESEGETVLKGVFFAQVAQYVGGAVRDAILN